jgi:uncharacterized coiled-coil DUF342 family protein
MKLWVLIMLAIAFVLSGCGGGADVDVSVADVEKDSTSMSVDELKAKASEYKAAIATKLEQIEPLTAKLKEIPLAQQMGEEAKGLQADIAAINDDVAALKERLNVYLEALKEHGITVSDIK